MACKRDVDYQSAIRPIANRRYRASVDGSLTDCRGADWQSAVSPVGNRLAGNSRPHSLTAKLPRLIQKIDTDAAFTTIAAN